MSRVVVAMACLACGCAMRTAGPSSATPEPARIEAEPQLAQSEYTELLTLSAQLDELTSAAQCGGACDAGARICELTERICAIADRNAGDTEIEGRCADARVRCDRARARLAELCACAE